MAGGIRACKLLRIASRTEVLRGGREGGVGKSRSLTKPSFRQAWPDFLTGVKQQQGRLIPSGKEKKRRPWEDAEKPEATAEGRMKLRRERKRISPVHGNKSKKREWPTREKPKRH